MAVIGVVVLVAVIRVVTVVVVIGVTAVVLVLVISVFAANHEEMLKLGVVDTINDEGFNDFDELVAVLVTTDSVVVPLTDCFVLADKCRRLLALSII